MATVAVKGLGPKCLQQPIAVQPFVVTSVCLSVYKCVCIYLCDSGSVLCGLVPTLYAAGFQVVDDLLHFYHTRHSKLMFQGIPVVILWSVFLAVAIQLHTYTLYFAWSLLRAWKQRAAELRAHKTG